MKQRNRPAIVRIFFVEQAFKEEDGTKGGVGDSGHIGTSGKIINGKNRTNAIHHIGGTTVFGGRLDMKS